jgi:hypothetical protein
MSRAAKRAHGGQVLFTPKEAPERVSPQPATEREQHARRVVWRRLVEAHDIRDRMAAGQAFPWEAHRLASLLKEARAYAHLARAARAPRATLPPGASGLSYRAVNSPRSTDQ